jgi:hypothetical protein
VEEGDDVLGFALRRLARDTIDWVASDNSRLTKPNMMAVFMSLEVWLLFGGGTGSGAVSSLY